MFEAAFTVSLLSLCSKVSGTHLCAIDAAVLTFQNVLTVELWEEPAFLAFRRIRISELSLILAVDMEAAFLASQLDCYLRVLEAQVSNVRRALCKGHRPISSRLLFELFER